MAGRRRKCRANSAPQPIISPSVGIWTPELTKEFYGQVEKLNKKLKKKCPEDPENYRGHPRVTNPSNYSLSYEDELHLADHFAFLAATEKTPDGVSATVLEEQRETPGLILRLASNQNPKQSVIDGLSKMLSIVQQHARAGKDKALYKEMLLHAIVEFSQQRIYSRLRTSSLQWEDPHSDSFSPLHIRIHEALARTYLRNKKRAANFRNLKKELVCVCSALEGVDDAPENEQLDKLKEVVKQCYDISHHSTSNSFEKRLKLLGTPKNIYQSSEVRQIDKLGKYWEMCRDLIRQSRQERSRPLFTNFQLDVLEAPPPRKPDDWEEFCKVHGEVQLVLFYEQHPMDFPPRAIGSSKSACLLCDQFIKLHGKFGISHSHKRLYIHWTIPVSNWLNPIQRTKFQNIVENMAAELKTWTKMDSGLYITNSWADSKANVWDKRAETSTDSSVVSLLVVSGNSDEDALPDHPLTLRRNSSASSSKTVRTSKGKERDTKAEYENTMSIPHDLIPSNNITKLVEEGLLTKSGESSGSRTPTQSSQVISSNIAGVSFEEEQEVDVGKEGGKQRTEPEEIASIVEPMPSSQQQEQPTSTQAKRLEPTFESATYSNNPIQQENRDSPKHDVGNHQDKNFMAVLQEASRISSRKRSNESLVVSAKQFEDTTEETLFPSIPTKQTNSSPVQQTIRDSNSAAQQKIPSPTISIATHNQPEVVTSPPHLTHNPNIRKEEQPETNLQEIPPPLHPQTTQPQPPKTQHQNFTYHTLPLSIPITPTTKTFTLSAAPVTYTFDLSSISHGQIDVFKSDHRGGANRVNIKKIKEGEEVERRPVNGERKLEFGVYFGKRNLHKLRIEITWYEGGRTEEE